MGSIRQNTTKMRRFKIDSLEKAYEFSKPHQVTAYNILIGRMSHSTKGWMKVNITPELRELVIDRLVDTIGGHENSKAQVRRSLEFGHTNSAVWGLDRFIIEKPLNNHPCYLTYVTGQDMVVEMNQLRKNLRP